jgi:L-ascorbate metabolism protein UlaG (beta-lactamase superfamily)
VIEMDWWQEIPFHDELKIAYTPAQHASGRGVRDQNRAYGVVFHSGKNRTLFLCW